MKRFLSILAILVLGLVITGCGSTPEQEALNNYLDEAKEITKIHENLSNSMGSVDFNDSAAWLKEYKDNALPIAIDFKTKTEALAKSIEDEEIKKVHELYVTTAQKYEEGIKKYISGLEKKNVDDITAANALIEEGTAAATKYADELTKLKEARGV